MVAEKTRCNNTWSDARFNSFIKSMLRRGSMRWLPKSLCKREARHYEKLSNEKGRLVFHSKCASCHKIYPETTCAVDHINSVVPASGFVSWDETITRMFCEVEGLQVLCSGCHAIKTEKEKLERKQFREN